MRRRHWALGASSTLAIVLLGLASPALARDEDDGEFIIQHARYGTDRNHVDVTGRLRELAREDRRFRLTNDLFGLDPEPGRQKVLRIFARDRQGHERQFEYRERDWVDGDQFVGWRGGRWGDAGAAGDWRGGDRRDDGDYTIQYATYGTGRREVDVTDRLRELARRDQRFRLDNDALGGIDPDPGQTKRLRIVASDRHGQQRHFEYREYAVIDGNQFVGWRRGDWGYGERRSGRERPGSSSRAPAMAATAAGWTSPRPCAPRCAATASRPRCATSCSAWTPRRASARC
jgi:hypothetical protein